MARPKREYQITDVRPAGDEHQVLTVESSGRSTEDYQRRPCAKCPWRVDATGEFPAEAFRHSANTCYDMSVRTFACHAAGAENSRVCAGFLLSRSGEHNLAVRMTDSRRGSLPEVSSDVPMYDTYREMAVANGVHPDDPVLTPCR